ncbi:DUF559 domain-containing protein [Luteimicrobium subarcticum]|uniref:Uncharacterized protein DUF559 n=1 Tax=Luteimicrobium subarcticum TaxID=620910 RepID=A0A2M8WSZ8_9MICO|nr:DUF559 domain-containing protein [Luteimicrobium subarcticum]PJI94075.1 uncharacterized protein DUF559 [Luteimicrobium subarcticum]
MPPRRPTLQTLLSSTVLARLRDLGGAAAHRDLVRDDAERNTLRNLVRAGLVVRAARATYTLPGTHAAVVTAARFGGHVDCVTAVAIHGIELIDAPRETHLAVPLDKSCSRWPRAELAVVRRHRTHLLAQAPDQLAPVQPLAHALARALVCRPRDQAVEAVDLALKDDLVTKADVARCLAPNAPRAAWTALALADGRVDSGLETRARLALVDAGFAPVPHVVHVGVGEVDLQVEHVIVECDGFEYHSRRGEYREDRRRDRELVARGFVVLRFTFEDVMGDPTIVPRAVRAALAAPDRTAVARMATLPVPARS